ncbi:MAG TPA: sigma-70 family RNA polymerase sigma factor [Candidatus Krumholzibacteria bacterium]|nr:sigma-70 family RNA polymerase sigma factor [Candidatus Krumholzibacteria bacterium]HRX51024.1 sigma-70 family RNA polymerase sigma factor [Candidatus Krumholzibacteria bacterium]
MELARILEHCRDGDELAWEMLVRRYQSRVYAIARTYVRDPDEARDLAQDVFLRLYRNLDGCREAERFLPWLIRIARNAAVDHLRRRKARPPARDLPAEEAWDLAHPGPSPEDHSEEASRRRLVAAGLRRLSDINREIIMLKDMQGLPLEEIADLLDLPLGTVKSRSSRARVELAQAVRELMTPPGEEATA